MERVISNLECNIACLQVRPYFGEEKEAIMVKNPEKQRNKEIFATNRHVVKSDDKLTSPGFVKRRPFIHKLTSFRSLIF